MNELAQSLIDLNWSDMDDFASYIVSAAVDDNGETNDQRYIAQVLLEWARDNSSE